MAISFQSQPFPSVDLFVYAIKISLEAKDVCSAAQASRSWKNFLQAQSIYIELFLKNKIPLVHCTKDQLRDYKQDLQVLYPITIGGRVSEELFGKIDESIPFISESAFKKCFQQDPFEPKRQMRNTFHFVVRPSAFARISNAEFPFTLNEGGDLIPCSNPSAATGEKLRVPNKLGNFKVLCEYSLSRKRNRTIFSYFLPDVLEQCNTQPDKIRVDFIKRNIADETRTKSYQCQKLLVAKSGFEVASLQTRLFFDAIRIFTTDTCPDAEDPDLSLACTSDTIRIQGKIHQITIGGFHPDRGVEVSTRRFEFHCGHFGVVPVLSANR